MVLTAGQGVLAGRRYAIRAPRQRVWDLLAGTIVQCLPVEAMQVVDDTTFIGVLKVKIGPFSVPVHLKVRAADISPADSLTTLVTASKGPLRSSLNVRFALEAQDEASTSVVCTASDAGGSVLFALLRGYQRRFSNEIFESVREELERSC